MLKGFRNVRRGLILPLGALVLVRVAQKVLEVQTSESKRGLDRDRNCRYRSVNDYWS